MDWMRVGCTQGNQHASNLEISDFQFTKRRSCTLIAKPIAMKVAMSEARPALINGSGTPMTGKTPRAMPTLIKI